ncbi:hypothetical protein [Pseudogemmobacter sonorensis]|uniref:hypothetical protein n=1 Tax=Pseudogemmobacter sonorensis TaxID=2989681 RepID=UPI00368E0E54
MSLLQKAVRRGRLDLALQAASTLLAISPDRFWRRAGIIAFEDIGVADLTTAGVVTVALEGKRVRHRLGGEWAVAAAITARMVAAPGTAPPMTCSACWKAGRVWPTTASGWSACRSRARG